MNCAHCQGAEKVFDQGQVSRWLRQYRRSGPSDSTGRLVRLLNETGAAGHSLLDVGGGIGTIAFELFESGLKSATLVEASAAAAEAARSEAAERGLAGSMDVLHGDYVDLAQDISGADIVTLDRVICCYPDVARLVGLASAQAGQRIGAVFPRAVWWARLAVNVFNLWFWVQGNPFRVYLHSPDAVDAVVRGNGFSEVRRERSGLWEVVVYKKQDLAGRSNALEA